jgi:hypothetical protein
VPLCVPWREMHIRSRSWLRGERFVYERRQRRGMTPPVAAASQTRRNLTGEENSSILH